MKKTKIVIFILAIIVVAGVFLSKNITGNVIPKKNDSIASQEAGCLGDSCKIVSYYSASEVSQHNSKQDCWMIVDNQIYDLTSFLALGIHKPIDNLCGKDVTSIYPHDTNRLSNLNYIGKLK